MDRQIPPHDLAGWPSVMHALPPLEGIGAKAVSNSNDTASEIQPRKGRPQYLTDSVQDWLEANSVALPCTNEMAVL
jgi:hypothetical protein